MAYKDEDHPSFWECRLKLNPQYVESADNVCVAMSEGVVVTIDLSVFSVFFPLLFLSIFGLYMCYLVHTLYFSTRNRRHNFLMILNMHHCVYIGSG